MRPYLVSNIFCSNRNSPVRLNTFTMPFALGSGPGATMISSYPSPSMSASTALAPYSVSKAVNSFTSCRFALNILTRASFFGPGPGVAMIPAAMAGLGWSTRLKLKLWLTRPSFPVTVRLYVPGRAYLEVTTVGFALPGADAVAVSRDARTPAAVLLRSDLRFPRSY